MFLGTVRNNSRDVTVMTGITVNSEKMKEDKTGLAINSQRDMLYIDLCLSRGLPEEMSTG